MRRGAQAKFDQLSSAVEKSEGFCCPAPSEAAGIPFCCPVGSDRAFVLVTSDRQALSYAAIASATLSLALVVMNGFTAHSGRSAIRSLLHSSILFRPHQQRRQPSREDEPSAAGGGGAGVLPPGSEMLIPRDSLPT